MLEFANVSSRTVTALSRNGRVRYTNIWSIRKENRHSINRFIHALPIFQQCYAGMGKNKTCTFSIQSCSKASIFTIPDDSVLGVHHPNSLSIPQRLSFPLLLPPPSLLPFYPSLPTSPHRHLRLWLLHVPLYRGIDLSDVRSL